MKPGDAAYPAPTSVAVSAIMKANPPADTAPETRLRSALHRAGLRFRKNYAISLGSVRTRPDVVFPGARVAVFLDGCFWHRCPTHGSTPKANNHYWTPKLANNVERDHRINDALSAGGWTVVRVWEHEPPEQAVARVARVVRPCQ